MNDASACRRVETLIRVRVVSSNLILSAPAFVLTFAEIAQYVYTMLMLSWGAVGDSVWKTPGTCIGNSFGKIAISSVTGRDAIERDNAWREGRLPEKWRRVWERGRVRG